jgi:hypothetical protein
MSSDYNAAAVQAAISKDRRIGAKEAARIHALLRGREPIPTGAIYSQDSSHPQAEKDHT